MLNAKLINARKQRNSNVDSESSINAKLNKARKAKADKQLHKEYNDLKRQKQKLKKGKQNKNLCYSRFQSADASPDPSPDPLIIEKVKNSQRAKSRRRFSMRTIKIAAILIMISLPCYQMLRRFDIWPSRQTVKSRLQTTYIVKAEQLFEFSDIPNTVDQYRKDNKVDGKIQAILAVDAISLTPEICVTKKGFVTGLLQKELLSNAEMRVIESKFKEIENYCKSKKTLR